MNLDKLWQIYQPILESVLKFHHCLNSLWTDEFRQAMAKLDPHLIPVLEHNLSLMYLHYGVDYNPSESATKRPKKFRPAEKLYNWIAFVYEQTCVFLGLSARFGPTICSKYTPQIFINSSFHNVQNLPLCHFRWILSKFFTSFGKNCPESHFECLLKPLMKATMKHAFTKLDNGWRSYNRAMANEDTLDQKELQREVLQETALRESSKKFIDCLQALLISPTDKGSTTKRVSNSKKKKKSIKKHARPYKQDILTAKIMEDQEAVHILFTGLCAAFLWADTHVHKRICHLGRKIALLVVDKEKNIVRVKHALPHLSRLMYCALQASMKMADNDLVVESAISDLVQTICTTVGRHSESPQDILRSIPNVDQNDFDHLAGILSKGSDKRCRTSTRKFIERYVVGKDNANFRPSAMATMPGLRQNFMDVHLKEEHSENQNSQDFTLSGYQQIFGSTTSTAI